MAEQEKCLECGVVATARQFRDAYHRDTDRLIVLKARIAEVIEEKIDDAIAAGRLHEKYMKLKSALSQPEKYPEIIKAEVKELFDCAIRENRNVKRQLKFAEDDLKKSKARVVEFEAENKEWRNVIACLCGDGGHYHVKHGTEKTKEYVLKRFYGLVEKCDRLQAIVDKLPQVIEDALDSYRTSQHKDSDGNGLMLCDVLSPPFTTSVRGGMSEQYDLHDHLCGAIIDATREAAEAAKGKEA